MSAPIVIEIKRHYTGAVLYRHETTAERQAGGLAMRDALEAAHGASADLSGANLRDANGATLTLVGERPALSIGPIGSRAAYLLAFITDAGTAISAGCFFGQRDEFAEAVEREHGNSINGDEYRAALVLIDAHARLWTPAQEPAIQEAAA